MIKIFDQKFINKYKQRNEIYIKLFSYIGDYGPENIFTCYTFLEL